MEIIKTYVLDFKIKLSNISGWHKTLKSGRLLFFPEKDCFLAESKSVLEEENCLEYLPVFEELAEAEEFKSIFENTFEYFEGYLDKSIAIPSLKEDCQWGFLDISVESFDKKIADAEHNVRWLIEGLNKGFHSLCDRNGIE